MFRTRTFAQRPEANSEVVHSFSEGLLEEAMSPFRDASAAENAVLRTDVSSTLSCFGTGFTDSLKEFSRW